MKKSIRAAAIVSLAVVGLLSGCSTTHDSLDSLDSWMSSPYSDSLLEEISSPSPDFFGAWSVIDDTTHEPALSGSPAKLATNGSVELIYMFQNGGAPAAAVSAYVVGIEGVKKFDWFSGSFDRFALVCNDKVNEPNALFTCTTGRFFESGRSMTYLANVLRNDDTASYGSAFIKRGDGS